MKSRFRFSPFVVVLVVLGTITSANAQSITWAGSGDGTSWSDPLNWSPARVPDAADDVAITAGGTYSVQLSVNVSVNSLVVGGSSGQQILVTNTRNLTLADASSIETRGILRWTGGVLATDTLMVRGGVQMEGPATMTLGAGVLLNTGAVTWTGGSLYFATNSVLDNRGTFDIATDNDLRRSGVAPQTLINTGTLRKSVGAENDHTFLDVPVTNNDGAVSVEQGNLQFTEGGTYTRGTYAADDGTKLWFNGGTHVVNGTLTGSPVGDIAFLTNLLEAGTNGAILDFDGTGFQWQNTVLGSAVEQTLTNTGLMRFTTSSTKSLGPGSLINTGTLRWEEGAVYFNTNSTFDNRGTFDIATDNDVRRSGVAPQTLINTGTLRKSVGAENDHTFLDVPVTNNDGTISVEQGNLQFTKGGTYTRGTYAAADGTKLWFNGGTHVVNGTLTGSPVGDIAFLTNLLEAGTNGAILDFDGTGFQWQNTVLGSAVEQTLTNTGLMRFTTSSTKSLGPGSLINTGTLRWEEGAVYFNTNSTFDNRGTFDIATDNDVRRTGVAPQTLINTGTLRKSVGAENDHTFLDVPVTNNDGAVSVEQGNLQFTEGGTYTRGTYAAADGTKLWFNGGTHVVNGTLTGSPVGDIAFLTNLLEAGANGAILDFDGTGFQWQNTVLGSAVEQTLTNIGLMRFTTSFTKSLGPGSLINTGTLRWEEGAVYFNTNSTFDNRGTFDIATDNDVRRTGVAPQTLINTGTLRKSVGAENDHTFLDVPVTNNDGTISVEQGELQLTEGGTYTSGRYIPSAGTIVKFIGGTHTLTGTFRENVAGSLQLLGGTTIDIGLSGATFDFTGNGFEWLAGTIGGDGTLRNLGQMILTSTSGKTLTVDSLRNEGTFDQNQGFLTLNGAVFRNDSQTTLAGTGLTLTQSTLLNNDQVLWQGGNVNVNQSTIVNAGVFDLQDDHSMTGFDPESFGFVNEAGGLFVKSSGDGTAIISPSVQGLTGSTIDAASGTLRFTGSVDTESGAILQGNASLDFATADFTNGGSFQPGTSAGRLTYVGTYSPSSPEATLQIELGGTMAETDYDVLAVEETSYRVGFRFIGGDAVLGGGLEARLIDGYAPQPGSTFDILIAPQGIAGGFASRTGLIQGDISLYPTIGDTTITLTAVSGVPTITGSISAQPASVVGDQLRSVIVRGSGFGPDVEVRLQCTACQGVEDDVTGLVGTITPTEIGVVFDLRDGRRLGTYDLVVTDTRGGEARTTMTVEPSPLQASVTALQDLTSEADGEPGLILIRLNRPSLTPIALSYTLGGTATLFADYSLDILGGTLSIPAGIDSTVVAVFPVSDDIVENEESVTFSVSSQALASSSGTAFIRIADGPATNAFAVYASKPRLAGNIGTVTVTIGGQGFTEDATVRLAQGGGAGLTPIGSVVDANGTRLRAVFDVNGQATGVRDLVIENGDGASKTLVGAITLEPAVFPEVFVQVTAPPRVPRTRERTYTVIVHNRGNVDVTGSPAISGLPFDAEWTVDPTLYVPPSGRDLTWKDLKALYPPEEEDETQVIMLPRLLLGPGEIRRIDLRASISTPQTLSLIGAWVYDR